jgi:Mn2+/Fe2+ NRAMP family transporter
VTVTDAQTRSRQTCALGIIGTGMLAVPVLAGSAAYAVREAFGWNSGFSSGFQEARGFYLIIVAATILGTVVGAFEVVMLWIGQSRRLMGAPTISRRHRFFGW